MNWIDAFTLDNQPSEEEIADFISSPLWNDLNEFMQTSYEVTPMMSYSSCSGQPGWNVKYQKGGRSLCTLYPMPGFFIALVVIGTKEYEEALTVVPTCSEYIQKLFNDTPYSTGGRWLMIDVRDARILEDTKRLIQIRRKIKKG